VSGRTPQLGIARNQDARRLLEWTGERMVPWTDDPAIAYEHLHRYLFAARLAAGKRVLDLGSGEGYGSALLASTAETVVGVDIDEQAIAHARLAYPSERLRFERTSADDLSTFDTGTFDVVTCFEVIEHVDAQERVIAEARRVLTRDGVLLCSTPERDAYRARTSEQNPFHVRELDETEFRQLLAAAFPHVAMWSQTTLAGSLLEPLTGSDAFEAETFHIGRSDRYWDVRPPAEPLYLVALASAAPLAEPVVSVAVDPGMGLSQQERSRAESAERKLRSAQLERAEAEKRLVGYRAGMEMREAEVRQLVAKADALRAELLAAGDAAALRESECASKVAELTGRLAQFEALERSVPYRAARFLRRLVRRLPDIDTTER
jgi:SAM-dependent methyltransferase